MEKRSIKYGNKIIEYTLQRKNVKNINLKINAQGEVSISANYRVPIEKIDKLIKDKAVWIINTLNDFEKVKSRPKYIFEYVSGESINYLGRQYRLKVLQSEDEYVKYYRGRIEIHVKDKADFNRKRNLFENWIKNRSKTIYKEILEKMYPKVRKYGINKPTIYVRKMRTRWGSCQYSKNCIFLNSELIRAPKYSIEYVVLHELIHFIHNDHSKDFYDLLSVMMPDWKKRKAILDEDIVRDL